MQVQRSTRTPDAVSLFHVWRRLMQGNTREHKAFNVALTCVAWYWNASESLQRTQLLYYGHCQKGWFWFSVGEKARVKFIHGEPAQYRQIRTYRNLSVPSSSFGVVSVPYRYVFHWQAKKTKDTKLYKGPLRDSAWFPLHPWKTVLGKVSWEKYFGKVLTCLGASCEKSSALHLAAKKLRELLESYRATTGTVGISDCQSEVMCLITSSTAQGGGGSFKNRKPIGEIGCCESGMAERIHWWTERCLRPPLFLSLSLTIYLPTSLSSMYLSIYRSIYLSLSLFHLITYIPIYLSTYLPMYLSTYLSIYLSLSLSSVYLSSCLPVCLSICLSVYLPICGAVSFSVM